MNAALALLTITSGHDDTVVARMIADYMMESDRQPYWFSINHNPGPPRNLACPVDYDWVLKGRVGIKTLDKRRAHAWIVRAVSHGYDISREGGKPLTSSIAIARRRAENHQRPKLENDDDIPF